MDDPEAFNAALLAFLTGVENQAGDKRGVMGSRQPEKKERCQMEELQIAGNVDEGYGRVADVFHRSFTDYGEIGAACAVYEVLEVDKRVKS